VTSACKNSLLWEDRPNSESASEKLRHTHSQCPCENNNNNHFMALYLGLPGWADTRRNILQLTPIMIINHPLSTSSIFLYSILPVQSACLTVFLHNLFPSPLWSTSGYRTVHFIHLFTQSLFSFCNTCPCHCKLFCVVPRWRCLFLVSLSYLSLKLLSFTIMSYISVINLISAH